MLPAPMASAAATAVAKPIECLRVPLCLIFYNIGLQKTQIHTEALWGPLGPSYRIRMESVTTYCQASYLLSGKATYCQASYLQSGMHPTDP